MPSITMSQIELVKAEVERRIQNAINGILNQYAEDADKLKAQSRLEAIRILDIEDEYARLEEIQATQKELEKEEDEIVKKALAKVTEARPNAVKNGNSYYRKNKMDDINRVVNEVARPEKDRMFNEHQGLRRVSELELERDNIVGNIIVATSQSDLKQFMAALTNVLNEQPTELEKAAQAIQPVDDKKVVI